MEISLLFLPLEGRWRQQLRPVPGVVRGEMEFGESMLVQLGRISNFGPIRPDHPQRLCDARAVRPTTQRNPLHRN